LAALLNSGVGGTQFLHLLMKEHPLVFLQCSETHLFKAVELLLDVAAQACGNGQSLIPPVPAVQDKEPKPSLDIAKALLELFNTCLDKKKCFQKNFASL